MPLRSRRGGSQQGEGHSDGMGELYRAIAGYDNKCDQMRAQLEAVEDGIKQHRVAIREYRQQLGSRDAVQSNDAAIARLREISTKRLKEANARLMRARAKANETRAGIDAERREIMLSRGVHAQLQGEVERVDAHSAALVARIKAGRRQLREVEQQEEEARWRRAEMHRHFAELAQELAAKAGDQNEAAETMDKLLQRAKQARAAHAEVMAERRLKLLAREHDHVSMVAKVKDSQRRVKKLQEAFKEVAAAVEGVHEVEDLQRRKLRIHDEIQSLQDHLHHVGVKERLSLKERLGQVRLQLQTFRDNHKTSHKRTTALAHLSQSIEALRGKHEALLSKAKAQDSVIAALVAGVSWLLRWLHRAVEVNLQLASPVTAEQLLAINVSTLPDNAAMLEEVIELVCRGSFTPHLTAGKAPHPRPPRFRVQGSQGSLLRSTLTATGMRAAAKLKRASTRASMRRSPSPSPKRSPGHQLSPKTGACRSPVLELLPTMAGDVDAGPAAKEEEDEQEVKGSRARSPTFRPVSPVRTLSSPELRGGESSPTAKKGSHRRHGGAGAGKGKDKAAGAMQWATVGGTSVKVYRASSAQASLIRRANSTSPS